MFYLVQGNARTSNNTCTRSKLIAIRGLLRCLLVRRSIYIQSQIPRRQLEQERMDGSAAKLLQA